MARSYVVDAKVRIVNRIVAGMTRLGIGPAHLMTVTGRQSGEPRTVPVTPIEVDGVRYLVAPYGPVGWVHNLRAAGSAELSKRGKPRTIAVAEVVDPQEAGRVLHHYATEVAITRPYFDAQPEDGVEAFAAEASAHPVFRID